MPYKDFYMSLCVRKTIIWVLTIFDTNQAVQLQKKVRSWKFPICVAKTKALISFAVTAKLICVFVFAYADCWFSCAAVYICYTMEF